MLQSDILRPSRLVTFCLIKINADQCKCLLRSARSRFYFYFYFVKIISYFTRSTTSFLIKQPRDYFYFLLALIFDYSTYLLLGHIENNRGCTQPNAFMPVEMHSTLLRGVSALSHTSWNLLHTNIIITVQFLSEFSPSLLVLCMNINVEATNRVNGLLSVPVC